MLVLGRKVGEAVYVGEGENCIKVTVEEIAGHRVRLSFAGPRDVKVVRAELVDDGKESETR